MEEAYACALARARANRDAWRIAGTVSLRRAAPGRGHYRGRVASWAEHAIWWQVYPLGFTGPEPAALPGLAGGSVASSSVRHRLPALVNWLDYMVGLGCNGLLLGPVFAAETHGYDTIDHFRIDPRLGGDEDFDALAAAAAGDGLRPALAGEVRKG